jgi:medium-chain acyl-[acyl-carrier-protein] hydrolase
LIMTATLHASLAPLKPHKGIVRLKPVESPRLRLVCFPYAGGSAAAFHRWGLDLPDDIELLSLQYPGRGGRFREPRLTHLAPIVNDACDALESLVDVPLAFFGHSMGATVAFEVARLLEQKHKGVPATLFLSGRGAPDSRELLPLRYVLPDSGLIEHLRDLAGTPDEVLSNPDLLEMLLPVLRSDLQAIETWVTADFRAISAPIVVFGGVDDPIAPVHSLDGWSRFSSSVQKRLFPGRHFFINEHQSLMIALMLSRLRELGHT